MAGEDLKNVLIYFRDEQLGEMESAVLDLKKGIESDRLHRYRIAFKKLDTLYDFLAFLGFRAKDNAHFRGLKRFFKAAGKYRDREIFNKVATETGFNPDPEIPKKFAVGINKALKKFRQADLNRVAQKTEKGMIAHESELESGLISLKDKLLRKIDRDKDPEKWPDRIHPLRRSLKKLYYLSAWMTDAGLLTDWSEKRENIKKAEQAIGTWHDYVVFYKSIRKSKLQPGKESEIQDTLKKTIEENEGEVRRIVELLND